LICAIGVNMSGLYFTNIKYSPVLDVFIMLIGLGSNLVFFWYWGKQYAIEIRNDMRLTFAKKKADIIFSKKWIANLIWGKQEVKRYEEEGDNDLDMELADRKDLKKKKYEDDDGVVIPKMDKIEYDNDEKKKTEPL